MNMRCFVVSKGLPLLRSFGRSYSALVTPSRPLIINRFTDRAFFRRDALVGPSAAAVVSHHHNHNQRTSFITTRSTTLKISQPPPDLSNTNGSSSPAAISQALGPTFQEAISRLQHYWASVGCALWLPHNSEVGAGTMNPATFLRVLGPEPWNVAYPEPSIRPDDSRYGDNPNRVQRHTQFQVILKPDPGNAQELYLGSLEALGIDTKAHDIRFVEDNWESPVLGAWGLGWEVWLDGMEVTQFTYFQQAGGRPLDAPAVEITYGMERILMSLQGVKHFKDIVYAPSGITYGEMFLQNEYEQSVYNLDSADVAGQRQRFAIYEKEARRLLKERLPIPAFDHLLKLSHAFNVMDARGAVGVTERADCFATLRSLAREVTALWLARREELGYPLGLVPPTDPVKVSPSDSATLPASPATFVLELGSEELPPDDVLSAIKQLKDRLPALLSKLRLSYKQGGITIEGTPRRLAVIVEELSASQPDSVERMRGPPASVAFDKSSGAPTPALQGFCRKSGINPEQCTKEVDGKGVEYIWAEVQNQGRPAAVVLGEELPALLSSINFKKSMRWRGETAYSRPLRWLLAMHESHTIPLSFAGLVSQPTTRLLRNSPSPECSLTSADDYITVLKKGGIMLEVAQRQTDIWQGVVSAAAGMNGHIPETCRGDLLDEVSNLVESPTVVLGTFDEAFLSLPREVLVTVMRKHQRYFPVCASQDPASPLLPAFITVANGEIDQDTVKAGNEAVLRARFEDAQFFYKEDRSSTLESVRPKLAGTVFQKDLGSLLDKSDRLEKLIAPLASLTGITSDSTVETASRAAHLSRADLATSMVTEMTELAGTMGQHYALLEGETAEVARAIFESVLPRNAGDLLPESDAGLLVSIVDKLDSLAGLFAAGCAPTASADPYGLRRAAVGLLQAVLAKNVMFDIAAAVNVAAELQPLQPVSEEVRAATVEFLERRLEQLLVDEGVAVEAVRAALKERGRNPALAAATAREISNHMAEGSGGKLQKVMAAMARPVRLTRGKDIDASWTVSPALFDCDEERALWAAYQQTLAQISPSHMSLENFLNASDRLVKPLEGYFDKVFVMCDDDQVRQNRLATLRDVASLSVGILDFSELPGF